MPWLLVWRLRALAFQQDAYALVLSILDRRVPLVPKALTAAMLMYTLSPADLVPDVLPLLGFLDDLGIVAAGVPLARGLIPAPIFEEHRAIAERRIRSLKRGLLGIFLGVAAAWITLLVGVAWLARVFQ